MAEQTATFEVKLARLEEIVRLLEGDAVPLQDAVALFNEGRTLAQACEAMLRDAQEAIEAPAPAAAAAPPAGGAANGSLFDDDALA